MFRDAQDTFSTAQALTVTVASTNILDFGPQGKNLSPGESMSVVVLVTVAASQVNGNETYAFVLVGADDTGFSVNVTTYDTVTIPRGTAAGVKFVYTIAPLETRALTNEYYKLTYTLGGTSPGVTVTAWMEPTRMIQNANVFYPIGYVVK